MTADQPTPPVAPVDADNPPPPARREAEGTDRRHAPTVDGRSSARREDTAEPRLPHEHDESSDSQQHQVPQVMKQAARDVERGLQDTSRATETDNAYRAQQGSGDGPVDDQRGVKEGAPNVR